MSTAAGGAGVPGLPWLLASGLCSATRSAVARGRADLALSRGVETQRTRVSLFPGPPRPGDAYLGWGGTAEFPAFGQSLFISGGGGRSPQASKFV